MNKLFGGNWRGGKPSRCTALWAISSSLNYWDLFYGRSCSISCVSRWVGCLSAAAGIVKSGNSCGFCLPGCWPTVLARRHLLPVPPICLHNQAQHTNLQYISIQSPAGQTLTTKQSCWCQSFLQLIKKNFQCK